MSPAIYIFASERLCRRPCLRKAVFEFERANLGKDTCRTASRQAEHGIEAFQLPWLKQRNNNPHGVPARSSRSGGDDINCVSTTKVVIPDGEADPGPCAAKSLGVPALRFRFGGDNIVLDRILASRVLVHSPPPPPPTPATKPRKSPQAQPDLPHQTRRAQWNRRPTRRQARQRRQTPAPRSRCWTGCHTQYGPERRGRL